MTGASPTARHDHVDERRFDRPADAILRITASSTGGRGAMDVAMPRELSRV